jgi:hypothetical protein
LEGGIADIGATRIARQPSTGAASTKAKQNLLRHLTAACRTLTLHNERANFPVSHEILPMIETVIGWLKKADACNTFPGGIFRKTTFGSIGFGPWPGPPDCKARSTCCPPQPAHDRDPSFNFRRVMTAFQNVSCKGLSRLAGLAIE